MVCKSSTAPARSLPLLFNFRSINDLVLRSLVYIIIIPKFYRNFVYVVYFKRGNFEGKLPMLVSTEEKIH